MDVDWWPVPVKRRRGSRRRLLGVDLYYDFDWRSYFPSNRAQFRNGLSLARFVRGESPPERMPGLLLSAQPDVDERFIEVDDHFLMVVNFPRYLREATTDAAAAYYARSLHGRITNLQRLNEIADDPAAMQALVDQHLEMAHITKWAEDNEERLRQLRHIAERTPVPPRPPSMEVVLSALRTLDELDPEIVRLLESLLGRVSDPETISTFLKVLTDQRAGRYATSEVLGNRIDDRLADAEWAAEEYERLLDDPQSTETILQRYIEQNPWLVGLEYVRVRPRRDVPRGTLDFILERFDGSHDLLELKSPADPIITAPETADGSPPPASQYSLSKSLAQALAQVHVYRDVLTEHSETVEKLHGLKTTRHPRLIIVVGQARNLPPHRHRVLRDLNLSLHRVEVVPYDVLVARTHTLLANVRLYLTKAPPTPAPQPDADRAF